MITGHNRIGYAPSAASGKSFKALDITTQSELPEDFYIATPEEIELTMVKAKKAFHVYKSFAGIRKAEFLEAIAIEMQNKGREIVQRAYQETALPEGRIMSEYNRTVLQLRMFASLIKEGSWVEASIDTAIPDRAPVPKPDLRRMLIPVGPVIVFTPSNFPLAYSTAGGDTASALAAGNPVIVKAHPSHPGTNALVADAVINAAQRTGMPDGVFSTLYSTSFEMGLELVKHPNTKSVAFTGSFTGGMALHKASLEREEPIPVFAEMGSVNPIVLLPQKIKSDPLSIAKLIAGSVTLNAGQFCTNPGLIAAIENDGLDTFLNLLAGEINKVSLQPMLNRAIWENYHQKRLGILEQQGISLIGGSTIKLSAPYCLPGLALVNYDVFAGNNYLQEEIFGPFSIFVKCKNMDQLEEFVTSTKGQLTVSVFGTDRELSDAKNLINIMKEKAGRFIINGVPTGVEVCPSMQHGGPFPASTDSRFTSVGTDAIKRFVRPIAFQNAVQEILPDELKDGNPLRIWRKVNNEFTKL